MVGKVRPCLVVSVSPRDTDRDLATLTIHTTSVRQTDWEVSVSCDFLKAGAFDVQNLLTMPRAISKFLRRLGVLNQSQMASISDRLTAWLGLIP
ncbi:MAG: type II toxin-antitoxin system PemK/MazF family toxin [Pirellulales bacterium]